MSASKLPSLSIINFLLCGGGILIFVFLLILPSQHSLVKLDKEAERINTIIEEQTMLFPLSKELFRMAQEDVPADLPYPDKASLKQDEISELSYIFQELAKQSNIILASVEPDIHSLIDDSGHLRVNLNLQGKFFDLRTFLIRLGELPYLEHIEQIQTRTIAGAEYLEIKLKVWLAKKQKE